MSIKLYGSIRSSSARCHWLLNEISLEYETITLDMGAKENKSPEYLALNPNGKVPTLVDNDFVIYESVAINNYLVRKYKPELYGANEEEMSLVDQWNIWSFVELYKFASVPLYFKLFGWGSEEQATEASQKAMKLFEILDNHLANKTYLLGDKFTVADINLGSVTTQMERGGFKAEDFVNILKYNQNLTSKPSYTKTFVS